MMFDLDEINYFDMASSLVYLSLFMRSVNFSKQLTIYIQPSNSSAMK